MTQQRRPVFFKMFIGGNNTGKSTEATMYATLFYLNNPRCEMAGYDPQYRFEHMIKPMYRLDPIEGRKKGWYDKIKHLRNTMLIFDDYRSFNRMNTASDDMLQMCEKRFEYGWDIIMVCHDPKFVLLDLIPYIDDYHIFYTMGNDANFEDRIPNYLYCQRAAEIMRDYVRDKPDVIKNPKQFYDGKSFNHKFPHIIVNKSEYEFKLRNLDKEWVAKNKTKFQIQL